MRIVGSSAWNFYGKAIHFRGEATGDRGEATGDRGEATGDRGEAPGDRGEATNNYILPNYYFIFRNKSLATEMRKFFRQIFCLCQQIIVSLQMSKI